MNSLEEEPPLTCLDRIAALLSFPLEVLFAWTVPNCADPRWEQYYVATFTGSIAWIGLLSFVMCDFSTRAGCVLGIPGLLMGLVFLAAGTSVPDALSSVAVGRSGMGDMAVSAVVRKCLK
jgi:Ca2+/Na+ antiporter